MDNLQKAKSATAGGKKPRPRYHDWLKESLYNKMHKELNWTDEESGQFSITCLHANNKKFEMKKHGRLYLDWCKTNDSQSHVYSRELPEKADCRKACDTFWSSLRQSKHIVTIQKWSYGQSIGIYQFIEKPLDLSVKRARPTARKRRPPWSTSNSAAAAAETTMALSHHHQQLQQCSHDQPTVACGRAPSPNISTGIGHPRITQQADECARTLSIDDRSIPQPAAQALSELHADGRHDVTFVDPRVNDTSASNDSDQAVAASAATAAALPQQPVDPPATSPVVLYLPPNVILLGVYVLPLPTLQQSQLENQPASGSVRSDSPELTAESATFGTKPTIPHRPDIDKRITDVQTGAKIRRKLVANDADAPSCQLKERACSKPPSHNGSAAGGKRTRAHDDVWIKDKIKRCKLVPDNERNFEQWTTSPNVAYTGSPIISSTNTESFDTYRALDQRRTPSQTIHPLRPRATLQVTSNLTRVLPALPEMSALPRFE